MNEFCYESAIGRVQVKLRSGSIVYFGWHDSQKFGDRLIRYDPVKKIMFKPLTLSESLQGHMFVSDKKQRLFFAYKQSQDNELIALK